MPEVESLCAVPWLDPGDRDDEEADAAAPVPVAGVPTGGAGEKQGDQAQASPLGQAGDGAEGEEGGDGGPVVAVPAGPAAVAGLGPGPRLGLGPVSAPGMVLSNAPTARQRRWRRRVAAVTWLRRAA